MPFATAFAVSFRPPSSPVATDLGHLRTIKNLVEPAVKVPPSSSLPAPIQSLHRGDWVKLICGASFEDVADVRNLSLVYTLAGVDCIDCAADASIVNAVNEGIEAARSIARVGRPWVMISVNDNKEDLHFRKAEFDPGDCPSDCPKPCEKVCPASAIILQEVSDGDEFVQGASTSSKFQGGVVTERCYGCGRCFSICPYDRISGCFYAGIDLGAMTYVRDPIITSKLLQRNDVDAIEIHTSGRRTGFFSELWRSLGNSLDHVKLVAVSLPDVGESTVPVMNMIYAIMQSHLKCYNLWQLDGRPMSGDIGRGATREAVAFAAHLSSATDKPHGFYQLAGGTNAFTVDSLKKAGLFKTRIPVGNSQERIIAAKQADSEQTFVGGIAYGGYARKIVGRFLHKMPTKHGHAHIEENPEYLLEALKEARRLVGPVKCRADPTF